MAMVKYVTLFPAALSLTFLDQCSFEYINVCGMVQNGQDGANWDHTLGNQEMKTILWWETVQVTHVALNSH